MSLFKKPKKNIRRRNFGDDEDGDENKLNEMEVDGCSDGRREKKESRSKVKQALLSFDDDEGDGEVFQVKKSSHSKKIYRLLDKERKKKKEIKEEKMEVEEEKSNIVSVKTEDFEVVLKTSEEEKLRRAEKKEKELILNGRAALAAGKDDMSSSDDDENSTKHKFSSPDHVKFLLESGRIPDAATIHAARKRRQRARELGNDFIPIQEDTMKNETKKGSRLIRDDDNDQSDDEGRIDMHVNLEAQEKATRQNNFYGNTIDCEPTVEDDEWESQQIRKGVTNVQLAQQALVPQYTAPTQNILINNFTMSDITKNIATPEALTEKLKERLSELKELNGRHSRDKETVLTELEECIAENKRLELDAPELADKFRFYQELRGYVTDLVECFDEKLPRLVGLEDKALLIWSERTDFVCERRRQDVRDQADEMSQLPKNTSTTVRISKEDEEARSRRAAEREGRRTRRRRVRELRGINSVHVDGMSSDDELTELESTSYRLKIEEVERLGDDLLEDVEDEFGTIDGVSKKIEKWREFDIDAYTEAYASLCLPKLLGPLVRLQLTTWNPVLNDCIDYESTVWWGRILLFGMKERESFENLAEDPDVLLAPLVVEKVIIPKITRLVDETWDPLSSSQTNRIVGLLAKLTRETPTLTPESKQLSILFNIILKKLKLTVDNDVFIPIHLKMFAEQKGNTSNFYQRQFASAVKILRNILSFQGLIGAEYLQEIALDFLLNRYLLAAMRVCSPCDAIGKASMILTTFPRWWFQGDTKIQRLQMFYNFIKQLSTQVKDYDTTEKEAHETVHILLKTVESAVPTP